MKKLLILVMISLSSYLFSSNNDIKIVIDFYSQSYKLNEPIKVKLSIVNTGDTPYTFLLSPLNFETFSFLIRTPQNERVEYLKDFQMKLQGYRSSVSEFRKVTLQKNETFSSEIDISEWFDFKDSGYYYIKGYFYPNPDNRGEAIESFDYKILIKPPLIIENRMVEEEVKRQRELENIMKLPPYEVIADFLDAKTKKDWERFLMHIDLERLILSFPQYYGAYNNARSGREQLEILDEFKEYLTEYWNDRILSYKVIETYIKANDANVIADVEYKVRSYSYIMRYTFYIYKNHNNEWMIYNYEALRIPE